MVVMAPKDENEMRHMMVTALQHDGPIAFRYPRGQASGSVLDESIKPLPIGKAEVITDGNDLLILAIGKTVQDAIEARKTLFAEDIAATVVNCRFVKPLDAELIGSLAQKIPAVITVEENIRQGGFGSAVLECLNDLDVTGFALKRIGIPDTFVEHGSQSQLRSQYGINAATIVQTAKKLLQSRQTTPLLQRQYS
jgi:1-deoxy-D-xylulose-5-phosphate synthase